MAKSLNIIIRLPSVQAVVVWVAQPWLPDQARQVVDQMRRRNKGDSAARTNRGAGGVARAGRGQSRSGATVAIDSLSLRWRRLLHATASQGYADTAFGGATGWVRSESSSVKAGISKRVECLSVTPHAHFNLPRLLARDRLSSQVVKPWMAHELAGWVHGSAD